MSTPIKHKTINTPYGFASSFPNLYETEKMSIERLERENSVLMSEIALERKTRYDIEKKVIELTKRIEEYESIPKRKRRSLNEIQHLREMEKTEYKTDGKRKSRPASSIRSYDDFVAIQNYFLKRNNIRDWMMWTIGVSLGLRISDLLSIKLNQVLNDDLTFREKLLIVEQKTNKTNNCLITESVRFAISKYFESIQWKFDLNDYLFKSNKTKGKMCEEYGWKILSDAGKALNLPIVIGSHTMRKSFANIAACVDKSTIDMNSITKIQGLLNHSDQRVTMKYLGTYQTLFDNARKSVSDFVLGKTDVKELIAGDSLNITDIISKIDTLYSKLSK